MLSKNKIIAILVGTMISFMVQADSLMPKLPKAKQNYNDKTLCVEEVSVMRKNHMDLMIHQRNDTLRKGIRGKQHSLKECIDCHNAPSKDDQKVASSDEKDHFCNACHVYTAVKIDCFDCHNDKPANTEYRHKLSTEATQVHVDLASKEAKPASPETTAKEQEGQK